MKPIEFEGQTNILAKDQPEYQPLPIAICVNGEAISCWKLSLWERIRLLFTGKLWLMQLTFGDRFQPQLPSIGKPFEITNG